MSSVSEKELIIEAAKGDRQAFRKLVEENQGFVYAVSYKILRNEDDALDAVQEIFIKMWKNLDKFDINARLKTWLYRIAANTCLDVLRKAKNLPLPLENEDISKHGHGHGPGSLLDGVELTQTVYSLSTRLSPIQRAVFVLRDLEGLSVNETAEALDTSTESIKSNLYHARSKMKVWLSRIYDFGTDNNNKPQSHE